MKLFLRITALYFLLLTASTVSFAQRSLGYNLDMGGTYTDKNYELYVNQSEWIDYGTTGKVKSGWLYCNEYGSAHAVVFFKIQTNNDGTGTIYMNGCANPKSTVCFKNFSGIQEHWDLCWDCSDGLSKKSYNFKWK